MSGPLMPLPGKKNLADTFSDDDQFNRLYPFSMQVLARRHWTPLRVAAKAAAFLAADDNVRILDIGSGVGKFCMAAAHCQPAAFYYGVEQRQSLINHGEKVRKKLRLENVSFVHGNFTQLDFRNYDHFYFFNSFYENLCGADKIDDSIEYSRELFNYYNRYLNKQLELKPAGTKLVTYYSQEEEVPEGYHAVKAEMDNLLKFWIKN